MNKLFSRSISIVMAVMVAMICSGFTNRGVVDRPFINSESTKVISINKIELSDTATVITARIDYRPGYWVNLSSKGVIKADGVSYPLQSATGIAIDGKTTIPDSGSINITMTFPAIPSGVESIDFLEGPSSNWNIWGIDLTGTADHLVNQHDVPAELLVARTLPMPETVITRADSTTINVHILGYRPEMGDKLTWYANTLHGQIGIDSPASVDKEGNATVKYVSSIPSRFSIITLDRLPLSGGVWSVMVAPGETVDVYIDSHISAVYNPQTGKIEDNGWGSLPDNYRSTFVSGVYPDIRSITESKYYSMNLYSGEVGDYRMNGDEYTDLIISLYKSLNDSIDGSGLGADGRRYLKAALTGEFITAATNPLSVLMRNYRNKYGWETGVPVDSIPVKLSAENISALARCVDFNDYDLLLSDDIKLDGSTVAAGWETAGIDPGVLKIASLYNNAYDAADNGVLNPSILDSLRSLSEPLAAEVEAHDAMIKARLEALGTERVALTPDVAPDEVFDAIIAPHKGKVVMVDLWNTWCMPCRNAIKQIEPEKSGELSSEDIVWIYIANQTSPRPKYLMMINDIKGIHYRVEDDQWRAICNRFNVDGIPFYILVDREGNVEARPDLRDHSAYKKAILDSLAR